MKHEIRNHEEWYTCDRCGKEIKDIEIGKIFSKVPHVRNMYFNISKLKILEYERRGYISNSELIIPEVISCEITEYCHEKEKIVHLCGKCKKEFERFMKNK